MSETPSPLLRKLTPFRVLLAAGLLVLIVCGGFSVRAIMHRQAERRWRNEIEQLGARTLTAGYRRSSSGIARVPIIGEIVTHHRQVELFVDDPANFDEILDKAAEFPELGRVWVNLNTFERSAKDRIQQKMPGMDVVFFTPKQ